MSDWQRWKNIMKCYPFEEKRLAKWKPPFIVQPKYDGVRCRALPLENREWLLLSSEENPIFSVPHINAGLKRFGLSGIELDGELYCHGLSFEQIISITSRTVNLHSDYRLIKFHIFDYVSAEPNGIRTARIPNEIPPSSFTEIAPFWLCNSLEEILAVYDKLIALNYEGIIVRNAYAPYERKRSTWVMKFKPKQEDLYEIIGVEEEISINGTPKARLGALTCRSGDGNTFSVGTGFNDELRLRLWEERDKLPGRVARVQYQHISSGRKVPRFPVFVEVVSESSSVL